MPFQRTRVIYPEILDDQPPGRAAPSLRDIVRINRLLGGHEVLRDCLRRISPVDRFSFLDVGAGSGDAAAVVSSRYPRARVTSLDYRLHHVKSAPGAKLQADAFHLPVRSRSFDIVHCALFLHHFSEDRVIHLLRNMSEAASGFVVVNDLERHVIPYYFLPATRWLFRWDAITLHDGPISVQAGFTSSELRSLASAAGLREIEMRVHRPSFRVSMIARV